MIVSNRTSQKRMLKMGFARDWVTLVMQCVSTINFLVLVSRSSGKSFRPSRGLRHGDPFSPYLFLFVSEVLSCLFQCATDMGFLEEIQIGANGPHLTHLLFMRTLPTFLRPSVMLQVKRSVYKSLWSTSVPTHQRIFGWSYAQSWICLWQRTLEPILAFQLCGGRRRQRLYHM